MRLDNYLVEFIEYLLLVLWVFADGKDQVLGRHAARLRTSEEESQNFVNNAHFTILKVLIDKQNGEEVTGFGEVRVPLELLLALVDDSLAEAAQSYGVAQLVALERRDVVAGKHWEKHNMRHSHAIDEV